ncbi:hypothetical protein D1872_227720 [compost metagenome]
MQQMLADLLYSCAFQYSRIVLQMDMNFIARHNRNVEIIVRLLRHGSICNRKAIRATTAHVLHTLFHRIVFKHHNMVHQVLFLLC